METRETIGSIVGFYVPYLCGVFDTVVKCKDFGYACDEQVEIEEVVMSITRDAWAAGEKAQKGRMQREEVLGSA